MFFSSFPHPFCLLLPLRLCSQKRDRFLSLHLLPPSFRPLPLSCREAVCHFFFLYAPLAMYSILPRAPAPPSAGVSSPTYCTPLLSRLRSILARRRRKGRGRESAQAENERTERQRTDGRRFRGAPPPPPPVPIPTTYSVSVYASLCMQLLRTQV